MSPADRDDYLVLTNPDTQGRVLIPVGQVTAVVSGEDERGYTLVYVPGSVFRVTDSFSEIEAIMYPPQDDTA